MIPALVAIGGNLGDARDVLQEALRRLQRIPDIAIRQTSPWYVTRPVGGPSGQPDFLNGAVLLETRLEPHDLLNVLRAIEMELGRHRVVRWGPRAVDLDLAVYGDRVHSDDELQIPHPRMAFRRFVLAPAADVAPELVHPVSGWTVRQLLANLDRSPRIIAVGCRRASDAEAVALRAAAETGAWLLSKGSIAAGFPSRTATVISDFWLDHWAIENPGGLLPIPNLPSGTETLDLPLHLSRPTLVALIECNHGREEVDSPARIEQNQSSPESAFFWEHAWVVRNLADANGPKLRVSGTVDQVVEEVVAAVESMQ
jgi:2-amino-4-hydroxy-6-hydroxymethyldihydropteridine diphosphokinase